MAKLTFVQLAQRVLTEHDNTPLSTEAIWNYAIEKNYVAELNSDGKTPQTTMGARTGQEKTFLQQQKTVLNAIIFWKWQIKSI